MPYTIVHCADVHLETTFSDVRGGARRRAALADAFARIVDHALAIRADALTIGGDLYESERAGPQTRRFLFDAFARFGGPVFVAPGNHDPHGASALLAHDDLPPNVTVFNEAAWRQVPLAPGLTLYGFGHTRAEPGRPFAGASFGAQGIRIALVHGSDAERCPPNKRATAPFTAAEIVAAGANVTLCGHYHGGYVVADGGHPILAYPGSPEPIKFGERGEHGLLEVRVHEAEVEIIPVSIARTRLLERAVNLEDAPSEHAVIARCESALADCGPHDYVRLRLDGTIAAGTRLDPALLGDRLGATLGGIEISDETASADYDALARAPNVRGHAIADLLAIARGHDPDRAADARRALRYAVAAFEGLEISP